MKKRYFVVAGAALLVAGWALFRPELLFIDQKVNESFPAHAVKPASMTSGGSPSMPSMHESMPAMEATVLLQGEFRAGAHDGRGTATIYALADGSRVLRLTDFETSNGPDLRVLAVAAAEAPDTDAVKKAGYREIAALKGNQGDQNYALPADLDLATHRAICIWCNRFSVNFTAAPLRAK